MSIALLSAFAALSLSAAGAAPTVVVETARDGALPCPANASLGEALALMLPERQVVARAPLRPDALSASLRYDGAVWTLVVEAPDRSPALSRTLEGSATDCAEVANASAVIVRRYVTDLQWPGQEVRIAPLSGAPLLRRVTIAAGPTVRLPVGVDAGVGVELAASARIGRAGFAQLGGWAMATPDLREVEIQGRPRGRLEARPLTFWAGGGACLGEAKAASLCGGAFAGTYLLPGSASGALYQLRARTILAPEVGALGQLSQPIASGLVLSASVRAGIPLLRTGVLVEGTSAQLTTPLLDAQVGLRLGWAISF